MTGLDMAAPWLAAKSLKVARYINDIRYPVERPALQAAPTASYQGRRAPAEGDGEGELDGAGAGRTWGLRVLDRRVERPGCFFGGSTARSGHLAL